MVSQSQLSLLKWQMLVVSLSLFLVVSLLSFTPPTTTRRLWLIQSGVELHHGVFVLDMYIHLSWCDDRVSSEAANTIEEWLPSLSSPPNR